MATNIDIVNVRSNASKEVFKITDTAGEYDIEWKTSTCIGNAINSIVNNTIPSYEDAKNSLLSHLDDLDRIPREMISLIASVSGQLTSSLTKYKNIVSSVFDSNIKKVVRKDIDPNDSAVNSEALRREQRDLGQSIPTNKTAIINTRTKQNLNLRVKPGTENGILGSIPFGERVTLTGNEVDGWTEVTYNGQTGWVSTERILVQQNNTPTVGKPDDLVNTTPTQNDSTVDTPTVGKPEDSAINAEALRREQRDLGQSIPTNKTATINTYTHKNLNLRVKPGTENGILGSIPFGEQVSLTGNEVDGWTEVTYNGQTGWVSTERIKIDGE